MSGAARRFQFDDPEDEYWNVSKSGDRFISFEDEPPQRASAQQNRKNDRQEPVDDIWEAPGEKAGLSSKFYVETVDWSGERVLSQQRSKKPEMDVIQSNKIESNKRVPAAKALSPNDLLLTASCLNVQPKNIHESQRFSLSPEMRRKSRGQSSASLISEGSVSSSTTGTSNAAQIDYSRLKAEHRKLHLRYEKVRQDRYRAPDMDETIRRLIQGETVILEMYRSKREKLELLDAALDVCDANVILAVVLFLKRTLSNSLFFEILLQKESAADHFVSHLREQSNQQTELITTLFSLGRNEDAAMVEFYAACKRESGETKVSGLKKALQSGFSDPNMGEEAKIVKEYTALLERQLPIDASDDTAMKQGREQKFKVYPKNVSLVDQPLLTTLYYCCLYHYDLPQNSYASPLALKELHKLSEKQFAWPAVKALARLKRWSDIERLLTNRKLFFVGPKLNPPITWPHLLLILSKYGASKDTLSKYLRHVPNSDHCLKLARKYGCNEVVIDCLIALKDREQLSEFITSTLTQHTNEYYHAQAALNNPNNKWKN